MAWVEDPFGKVLMIRQKRGRGLWSLPGGKVRAREALSTALVRELLEETGHRAVRTAPCAFYDRFKKGTLTVLFDVTLREAKTAPIQADEIAEIAFRATPPKNATPSLQYFWAQKRPAATSGKAKA